MDQLSLEEIAQEEFLAGRASAWSYLAPRRFEKSTLEEFGVGYLASSPALLKKLSAAGYSVADAEARGLKSHGKDGSPFWKRMTLPVRNIDGKIIGFSARIIEESDRPKYLNSPESDLFIKREVLMNLDKAYRQIIKKNRVIVVEGMLDAMAVHQCGFREVVAICGTAFTEFHAYQIKMMGADIYSLLDGDGPGQAASEAMERLAKTYEIGYNRIGLSPNEDPASILAKDGNFGLFGVLARVLEGKEL